MFISAFALKAAVRSISFYRTIFAAVKFFGRKAAWG
jgi:hypothetical protein